MLRKTIKLSRLGRRNFLKKLGSAGLSAGVLETISKDDLRGLTDDIGDRVPRVARYEHTNHEDVVQAAANGDAVEPEREAVYYTIPRDTFVKNVAPFELADALTDRFEVFDHDLVKARVSSRVNGHHRERIVKVVHRTEVDPVKGKRTPPVSVEALQRRLPAAGSATVAEGDFATTVDEIPIVVTHEDFEKQAYYTYNYQPDVPGGCAASCMEPFIYEDIFTLGSPCYDYDGGTYAWTSTGHVGAPYQTVDQPADSGDAMGSFWEAKKDGNFDACEIRSDERGDEDADTESESVEYKLAGDGGGNDYTFTVGGTLAWDTIQDNVYDGPSDDDYKITLQGTTSGTKKGNIVEAEDSSTYRAFQTQADSKDGDSGGPHWRVPDGEYQACIAGIHVGSGDNSVLAEATYIGEVESEFNVRV